MAVRRLDGETWNGPPAHAMETIRRLKDNTKVLALLCMSMFKAAARVESATRSAIFCYGINSLSSEIIAHIFSYLIDDCGAPATNFQMVSRRFRRIALSFPRLWTNIVSSNPIEFSRLQIQRSGQLPLSFTTHFYSEPDSTFDCQCEWFRLIREHAHRWRAGKFCAGEDGSSVFCTTDGSNTTCDCISKVKNLRLPSLEELDLYDACRNPGFAPIVSSWSLPSLTYFECSWPPYLTYFSPVNQLVHLRYRPDDYGNYITDHLDFFRTPIGSSLVILSLEVSEPGEDWSIPASIVPIKLEQLRTLNVKNTSHRREDQEDCPFIASLLSLFKIPNVEVVRLEFSLKSLQHRHTGHRIMSDWIKDLLLKHQMVKDVALHALRSDWVWTKPFAEQRKLTLWSIGVNGNTTDADGENVLGCPTLYFYFSPDEPCAYTPKYEYIQCGERTFHCNQVPMIITCRYLLTSSPRPFVLSNICN